MNAKHVLNYLKSMQPGQPINGEALAFIQAAIDRFFAGETLEEVFEKAQLPAVPRGKQSEVYKKAVAVRNIRLSIAATYMPGRSDWKRSEHLAALASRVGRAIKTGTFQPVNEPERILQRVIESGIRIPTTTRAVFEAISPITERLKSV